MLKQWMGLADARQGGQPAMLSLLPSGCSERAVSVVLEYAAIIHF